MQADFGYLGTQNTGDLASMSLHVMNSENSAKPITKINHMMQGYEKERGGGEKNLYNKNMKQQERRVKVF